MTSLFDVKGKSIPVTIIRCEPNKVLEVKASNNLANKDAYKVGYESKDEKKLSKPKAGIFKKVESEGKQFIQTIYEDQQYNVGDEISVNIFEKGEYVDVQGLTRGRGYSGAIVRWNFKIGPMSHGHGYPHRWQGSIAMGRGGSQKQAVPKGKKMAGQYGHETVTIQNLVIVDVDTEKNLILVQGGIPGPAGSIVTIHTAVKKPEAKLNYDLVTKSKQVEIEKANEAAEDKSAIHNEAVAEAKAEKK